jgi:hypothetical protein
MGAFHKLFRGSAGEERRGRCGLAFFWRSSAILSLAWVFVSDEGFVRMRVFGIKRGWSSCRDLPLLAREEWSRRHGGDGRTVRYFGTWGGAV